ncbi:MAG: hypothetical protein WBB07_12890 [Mycobacterium sp.]
MNQALFKRLYVADDAIVDVELTELFERLLVPDLKQQPDAEATSITVSQPAIAEKPPNIEKFELAPLV